jgi:hypothetical protein
MVNIISEVNKYVTAKTTGLPSIVQNAFTYQTADELMCRTEPSSVGQRMLDGSYTGELQFAYYSKSKNMQTAENRLQLVANTLDHAEIVIDDRLFINVELVSLPSYVQKTETGEHIFTSSYRLEYLNRRP